MLKRSPPRKMPTVITLGSSGERLRERIVCSATTACAAGHDRVDPEMRIGAVRLLAVDLDPELVDGGHGRPGVEADLADGQVGEGVEGEGGLGVVLLEQPLLQHQARRPPSRPAAAPPRRAGR